jgi:hypothetical protein
MLQQYGTLRLAFFHVTKNILWVGKHHGVRSPAEGLGGAFEVWDTE